MSTGFIHADLTGTVIVDWPFKNWDRCTRDALSMACY